MELLQLKTFVRPRDVRPYQGYVSAEERGEITGQLLTTLDLYPVYVDSAPVVINVNDYLTSLVGSPLLITDTGAQYQFNRLTNLNGGPLVAAGYEYYFSASGNQLTSLIGGPLFVEGDLSLESNLLRNLKGSPVYVGGSMYISQNPLTSLEGLPRHIEENLYMSWDTYVECIQKRHNVMRIKNARGILAKYYGCNLMGDVDIHYGD